MIYLLKERFTSLLRDSEKYTRTDMVYLARGGFWSFFSQIVGSLASFLVVLLLANFLSKEEFGQYRFVLSLISIIIILTLPGIDPAIIRSIARKTILDFPNIVKTKIWWGLWSAGVSLLISGYYFSRGNTELFLAFAIAALFLPFIESYSVYSSYFKGKEDFKTSATYESISRVFQSAIIILTAIVSKNILWILVAYFAGQLLARLFFYRKTLRDENLQSYTENKNADTIKYGKDLSGTQVVGTLIGNIDKLLVWHFLGAEILAVYYIALTIPKNLILLCNIIPRVAFPRLSQNSWEPSDRNKILRKIFIFLGLLIIPGLAYELLVPFAIPLLFKGYTSSVPAALVLGFLITLTPVNALIDRMLQAMKLVRNILVLQVVALIAFCAMFLVLYEFFGASPIIAAIALVSSEAISFLAGIWLIKKAQTL